MSFNSTSSTLQEEEEELGSEDDNLTFLSETEALEYVEFDPSVQAENSWEPSQSIKSFLERHFNKGLSEEERKKLTADFPKPSCEAVQVPKLDEQLKDHLKAKGKDPHYGSEKTLYKLQESLLDATGPLTSLWEELLSKEGKVSAEGILLHIQHALVLLGNALHTMSQERRKVAWAKINLKLRSLAAEDYSKRGLNHFGPGFLEKATKRMELDKTLSRVSLSSAAGPAPKKGKT